MKTKLKTIPQKISQGISFLELSVYRRYRAILLKAWPKLIKNKRIHPLITKIRYTITTKEGTTPRKTRPSVKWGLFLIIIVLCLYLGKSWTSTTVSKTKAPLPPTVMTAPVAKKDFPVYLTALGTVTPTESVTVQAQVNGQLMKVQFEDGQVVKKGDLLAEIDDRPFKAQLTQYEGQLARDTALLENAKIDLKRYKTLFKQDSISQQTLDTQIALVAQYEGNVKADKGLIEGVKVNLIYCKITSPLDGQIGLRLIDPGNFVQTSTTTGIAIINSINPIKVTFSIPEDQVHSVLKPFRDKEKQAVLAYDRWQNKQLAEGVVISVDNQIDVTTGTVKLKALFTNDDQFLFANQFVNVRLLINTLKEATVLPTAAIQFGSKGPFVYKLLPDQTVSIVPVKVQETGGEDSVVTIETSTESITLTPDDSVVIQGTDKLSDKAKVNVMETKQNTADHP
jgi:multidrug efflux system membrane fusion protein